MEVEVITPPVTNFLKVKLDQVTIDYLWKIIEIGKSNNSEHRYYLAGNISQSILIEDIDS